MLNAVLRREFPDTEKREREVMHRKV